MDIDQELRKALERREPPEGFAGRVMARLPAQRRRPWRAAAAVAAIAFVSGGAYEYDRARRVRHEAAIVKEQLAYALGVTSEKLQEVQQKVMKKGEL